MITESIRSLYTINLVEGEGLGTAYEYYVKFRKLKNFIHSIKKPKNVLIAGLPEKYGLSMDFFLLGQMIQAETVVIDERPDVLERAKKALWTLKTKKIFEDSSVKFLKVDQLDEFNNESVKEGKFDLALSSEVLQRFDGAQAVYISNLKKLADNFALFAPNQGNVSHATLSGLRGVYLGELLKHCQRGHSRISICDYGYVDMPPFPPGMSRTKEKREQAAENCLETFLMKGLELFSLCEDMLPNFIKEKKAHIIYVMAKSL